MNSEQKRKKTVRKIDKLCRNLELIFLFFVFCILKPAIMGKCKQVTSKTCLLSLFNIYCFCYQFRHYGGISKSP